MKFYTTSKLSENIHETPEGYLVCVGVAIARSGEMEYTGQDCPLEPGADGRVVVSRDESEVFRPETMASFEGKAVTILHPSEFVSPENWGSLAKGVVQNVRRGKDAESNDMVADLLITDRIAINLVKNGLREVSCGYEADWEETAPGRGRQKKIIGNHVALVEKGRAGEKYAINDHKGKGSKMKVGDRIKAIFAKAVDEAVTATANDEEPPKDKEKAKDAPPPTPNTGYDELSKMVKDLGAKIDAMVTKPASDVVTPPAAAAPVAVAGDAPDAPSVEDRLAKLEATLAKLLESQATDSDDDGDEAEDEEACDEDGDEDEGEDEMPKSTMTGDAAPDDLASRVEILAPGMDPKLKDVKRKAILAAYQTKDGKAVIDTFTAGAKPDLKMDGTVDLLFIGVSEGLKSKRGTEFAKTKTKDFASNLGQPKGSMTPEQVNEINKKHYGKTA